MCLSPREAMLCFQEMERQKSRLWNSARGDGKERMEVNAVRENKGVRKRNHNNKKKKIAE